MQLTPSLTIVPIIHGCLAVTQHIRKMMLDKRYSCIALDLPEHIQDDVEKAIEELPIISALICPDIGESLFYVPIDPCDAAIEALRQARQNLQHGVFIGHPTLKKPLACPALPDEYAIESMGFDAYMSLCLLAIGTATTEKNDTDARYCAARLQILSKQFSSVLALVHLRHFTRVVELFKSTPIDSAMHQTTSTVPYAFLTAPINPDHLYFALGELPFVTGKYERSRYDADSLGVNQLETIKELFRETRDEYAENPNERTELSPTRIKIALQFLRNLTLGSSRLLPSLFDIITAAKGIGGNRYALRILRNAKYYPYLPIDSPCPPVSIGMERIKLPGESHTREAINLLRDQDLIWQSIPLKADPSLQKQTQYRYRWNPAGMCSHLPEDQRIEGFNTHLRHKALRAMQEEISATEKFSTSVKDGIDIRETLRNWHTNAVYVKEVPPGKGHVDTVIILFDTEHDKNYPHRATWYAEHSAESTLSFYATDPFQQLVGPGVARALYGGITLLFPPQRIPDLFEVTAPLHLPTLAHQLTAGACLFSRENAIAFVSTKKPDNLMLQSSRRLKKKLIWIPLSSFNTETLRKLRQFHILNGKTVRSWATRFIDDA